MRKIIYGVLAITMMAFLVTGCAGKPSEEEVRAAIAGGTLTLDDAVNKGYVTEEWVNEYMEGNAIPANDKLSVNLMGAFTAETIQGEEFSFTPGDTPVLFAFADPQTPEGLAEIQTVEGAYKDIQSAGGDVVLVLMGEEVPSELSETPLPAIFYTEDMKSRLGSNTEMVDGRSFMASWNIKGSFITAWYGTLEQADLPQIAKGLVDEFVQPKDEETNSQADVLPMESIEG